MLTTKQTFIDDTIEKRIVEHLFKDREYEVRIRQGGELIVITLDNLKSILKVAKRNLKELSQKDKGVEL